MKVTSTTNQQIASKIQHDLSDIKSVAKTIEAPSFQERLEGLQNVANAQNNAAELAKALNLVQHLAKVMVSQQVIRSLSIDVKREE